jgi:Zn ribbon nucleic-acid-binding protein
MKELAGKYCRRCRSVNIALAASGEVIVVRCLDCTHTSVFCPQVGCDGRMLDAVHTGYREQKCAKCNYQTQYHPIKTTQLRMFKEVS